jgi:uncharacterized protein
MAGLRSARERAGDRNGFSRSPGKKCARWVLWPRDSVMTTRAASLAHPARAEWPTALDVQERAAEGWRPTPFRQFILKLHSRCNLACDYCYVYELADQTWRAQPRAMSGALIPVIAHRIAEHAQAHDLRTIRVIFHGGEPLLAGAGPITDALRTIRSTVGAGTQVDSWVQTNGTLLDEKMLDQLEALGIRVGVSLDGNAASHDRSRRYANGRGSHDAVARGLRLLMRRPGIYSGLLCVVELSADPVATYEAMLEFAPPLIDFHLPHGNWSSPPPGRPESTAAPYAEWLITVFDRWYDAKPRETRIRLFEEIIHLLLGGKSGAEAIGLTPSSLVIVESDGTIEQSDTLKSAYDGAAATGLHISRDSFDTALHLPQVAAAQLGLSALSDDCHGCPVRHVCGAGLYAHRYRAGSGFRNRSVYCHDLFALIGHVQARLASDLRLIPRS